MKNTASLASGLLKQGYHLVSGGTDNHLLLLDLSELKITGKDLEEALLNVAITVNKNTVPNDFGGLDVNWTVNNIVLNVNDVITITKPDSVSTRYAFSGDTTLEKDKVKIAGIYGITLTSSPDGFILAFNSQNVQ